MRKIAVVVLALAVGCVLILWVRDGAEGTDTIESESASAEPTETITTLGPDPNSALGVIEVTAEVPSPTIGVTLPPEWNAVVQKIKIERRHTSEKVAELAGSSSTPLEPAQYRWIARQLSERGELEAAIAVLRRGKDAHSQAQHLRLQLENLERIVEVYRRSGDFGYADSEAPWMRELGYTDQ